MGNRKIRFTHQSMSIEKQINLVKLYLLGLLLIEKYCAFMDISRKESRKDAKRNIALDGMED